MRPAELKSNKRAAALSDPEDSNRSSASRGKRVGTRNRVLHAATGLFAAKGFRGTSMREIAHRARVNEVTVFRLFGSKKELYLKVFEDTVGPELPAWIAPLLNSAQKDEITFSAVADRLQQVLDPIFTRLLFFAALEKPELVRRSLQPRIERFYNVLGRHIDERIHQGTLRAVETDISAQALVALIFYPRVFHGLLLNQDQSDAKLKKQIKHYVDIWLHGVTQT